MINKYIFMAMLCAVATHGICMDRRAFSGENRTENRREMSAHIRPQAVREEGIVPDHDLITLELQSSEDDLQCGPERLARISLYCLGFVVACAQYGPSVYAALWL